MSRELSDDFLRAIYEQESSEILLTFVRLNHPDWNEELRLVNYVEQVTKGGLVYNPWSFSVQLPDDEEEGTPILKWRASNVETDIVQMMRGVTGDINATVMLALRSSPNINEVGPFDVVMQEVKYDEETLKGDMSIDPILDENFCSLRMNPSNAPGLF